MADEDLELDVKSSGGGGGGNTKLIIIMGVFMVVIAVVTAVLTSILVGGSNEPEVVDEVVEEIEVQPAFYVPITPDFIVNYHSQGRLRYLKVSVELMGRSEEFKDIVNQHMPMIKDNLVSLFAAQDFKFLQTREGQEKLRDDSLEEVQRVMLEYTGEPTVEKVLFTQYVLQ